LSDYENKSEYERILGDLRTNINGKAANYVPQLATALINEEPNRSASEIVDIIKKDCGFWARETIRNNLPEGIKDEVKQKAGKKGAAKTNAAKKAQKKAIEILADGSVSNLPTNLSAEHNPVSQKESNSADLEKNVYQSTGVPEDDNKEMLILNLRDEITKANAKILELSRQLVQPARDDRDIAIETLQNELAEARTTIFELQNKPQTQMQAQGQLRLFRNEPIFQKLTIGINKMGAREIDGIALDYSGKKITVIRAIKN